MSEKVTHCRAIVLGTDPEGNIPESEVCEATKKNGCVKNLFVSNGFENVRNLNECVVDELPPDEPSSV